MPESQPVPSRRAVFLSYAREDTDAARRIADALRSHDVEVWLDQSELVGGDAWDGKIRGQIGSCALFIPVISANTQARKEGYFRLEWKLAEDRSHLMAKGVPFIVPVSTDATSERGALVPDAFLAVQWTRLPGGETSSAFVGRVKTLLGPVGRDGSPSRPPDQKDERSDADASERRPYPQQLKNETAFPPTTSGRSKWVLVSAALLVLAGALYFGLRPTAPPPVVTAAPPSRSLAAQPPLDFASAKSIDKSIAVLPFGNLSPDKENEYFADGIHEDVLTNLQNIRELRVVSRTSVMGYRGTTKKIGEIARELGVAYILEGSVRRAGNTVRVSAQLIDARTDAHLWSPPPYDRELTATSIFAIQSDIAESIARALQAKLSPQEKSLVERRPTENLEAYNLFLKAREQRNSGFTEQTRNAAIAYLDDAVRLDPNFARAWADLSWAHASLYFLNYDHSSARAAKSKAAIELATLLDPEAPDVILNLGYYHFYCRRDYARAMQEFEKFARLQPGGAEPRYAIANLQAHEGKWREALEGFREAIRLEPRNQVYSSLFSATAQRIRRWDEVLAESRRVAELSGSASRRGAEATFWAQGLTRDLEEEIARRQNQGSTGTALPGFQMRLALARGDYREVIRLGPLQSGAVTGVRLEVARALPVATSLLALGDGPAARAQLQPLPDKLRAQLKVDPENPLLWSDLGMVEALLGRKDEAVRSARRGVELFPIGLDPADAPYCRVALAFVLMWVGDKEGALAEYKFLLGVPIAVSNVTGRTEINVHLMRHHPYFFPLQGDPRFEALLNDPKNNEPLF